MADIAPAGDTVIVLDDAAPAAAAEPAVTIDDSSAVASALPPGAELLAGGAVRLPLAYPVTVSFRSARTGEVTKETTAELVLHRLNGAAVRAIQAASEGNVIVVSLAQAMRLSEAKVGPLLDRMDAADLAAASDVIAGFLGNGRKTGR
jgi:hypothetical protein